MICGRCKSKIESGLESCPVCGARFKKRVETEIPVSVTPQPAAAPPTPPVTPILKPIEPVAPVLKPIEPVAPLTEQEEVFAVAEDPMPEQVYYAEAEPQEPSRINITVKGDKKKTVKAVKDKNKEVKDKPQGKFLKAVKPFLEMLSRVLAIAGLAFLLIGIVTAKIPLIKVDSETVEGFLKVNIGLSIVALLLGLAALAAAVMKVMLPPDKESETRKGNLVKMIVPFALAAAVTLVSFIAFIYCL